MKPSQKKRLIQKLWAWISLFMNGLIASLYLIGAHTALLGRGIFISIMALASGVLRISLEKEQGEISVGSTVKDYICMYILTLFIGIRIVSFISSLSVLIALGIAVFVETLVFLLITYWHSIRRYFSKYRHREK